MGNKKARSRNDFRWTESFSKSLETPQAFPCRSREAAGSYSDLLYAWDEQKQDITAKRRQRRAAAARIGVKTFSWEGGQ